jgi:hypothetical protein
MMSKTSKTKPKTDRWIGLRELYEPETLISEAGECLLEDDASPELTTVEIEAELFYELCRLVLGDEAILPPAELLKPPKNGWMPKMEMPDWALRNFLLIVQRSRWKRIGRPRLTEDARYVRERDEDRPVEDLAEALFEQELAKWKLAREKTPHRAKAMPRPTLGGCRLKVAAMLRSTRWPSTIVHGLRRKTQKS